MPVQVQTTNRASHEQARDQHDHTAMDLAGGSSRWARPRLPQTLYGHHNSHSIYRMFLKTFLSFVFSLDTTLRSFDASSLPLLIPIFSPPSLIKPSGVFGICKVVIGYTVWPRADILNFLHPGKQGLTVCDDDFSLRDPERESLVELLMILTSQSAGYHHRLAPLVHSGLP